jgi:hypothetical protein
MATFAPFVTPHVWSARFTTALIFRDVTEDRSARRSIDLKIASWRISVRTPDCMLQM